MVSIKFYEDRLYEEVIKILKECELYDETWETRQNLKHKIERDSESILVALNDKKVVGCVFIMEDGWNAFIWRLGVKPSFRKEGIGLMLMQKAEEIIESRGIKESCLLVNPKDERLKEWYKKQSYVQARDWTFMYKKLNK